ncbi:hypothetical protein FGK63_05235 [Ruegeria sediminis]|uniref:Uncharacterized protein n=1 Tax=Ruegeria sediminis TaxID=2583820 RepID=A0ABY2X0P9_9RHOB|nr:hypothetical protein [Ruegeria sediminis]TMV08532.1 hypothetical protein FGK63_05235 [Ruegeria sediminis]
MTKTLYTRPAKTKATAVGEKNRLRWNRQLRKKVFHLIKAMDFMLAEETATSNARKYPWDDRPTWVTTRIRIDQLAILELLQKRHLETTGKEISRAEVLAALMAAGLEHVVKHEDFGGNRT